MRTEDNVTASSRVTAGLLLGALGVLAFSFTLPATRLSVAGLDPWFVAFGRAAGAGILAAAYLALSARRPTTGHIELGDRTPPRAQQQAARPREGGVVRQREVGVAGPSGAAAGQHEVDLADPGHGGVAGRREGGLAGLGGGGVAGRREVGLAGLGKDGPGGPSGGDVAAPSGGGMAGRGLGNVAGHRGGGVAGARGDGSGPWPTAAQLRRLVVVAGGVVIGFPLFTSIALTQATAAHGAVVVALLPATTAVFAVVRGGERPSARFWLAAGAGFTAVLVFVAVSGGMVGGFRAADLWFLAAVVACALGYAEGGAIARELGGARTICWALVLALPVTIPVAVVTAHGLTAAAGTAWLGFAYVTVISQFLGFFAWYAGLARGGVARIGQVQALQPVLTLTWSALLLREHVDVVTVAVALVVLGCVVLTQRAR